MSVLAPSPRMLFDRDAVVDAFRLLFAPGQVAEVRIFDATTTSDRYPKTLYGYFDDAEALGSSLRAIRSATSFHITLNPTNPALLARAANRLKKAESGGSTGDKDIERRRWMLIDLDPQRPSKISSSDEEKALAVARAEEVRSFLKEMGWPEPVAVDSGNGMHLLFRIDLPTDDQKIVEHCLEAIEKRFSDTQVKVDRTVHNPSQLTKLPGTMAGKGDDIPTRPHRMSRIVSRPDVVQVVPQEKLEALASEGRTTASAPNRSAKPGGAGTFNLKQFIERHHLKVGQSCDWDGGRKWVFTESPLCDHGNKAFLGQREDGAIVASCRKDSCDWNWHDLRAHFESPETRTPQGDGTPPPNGAVRPDRVSAASGGPERDVPTYRTGDIEVVPVRLRKAGAAVQVDFVVRHLGEDRGQLALSCSSQGPTRAAREVAERIGSATPTVTARGVKLVLQDLARDVGDGTLDYLWPSRGESFGIAAFVREHVMPGVRLKARTWDGSMAYPALGGQPRPPEAIAKSLVTQGLIDEAMRRCGGDALESDTVKAWRSELREAIEVQLMELIPTLPDPPALAAFQAAFATRFRGRPKWLGDGRNESWLTLRAAIEAAVADHWIPVGEGWAMPVDTIPCWIRRHGTAMDEVDLAVGSELFDVVGVRMADPPPRDAFVELDCFAPVGQAGDLPRRRECFRFTAEAARSLLCE